MSVGYIALIIVLTVSILIVLVSKFKLHAAISLYITSMLLAILVGTPMEKIPKMINDGFGNTCKGIAMVIFLGSLLGIILNKTGAIVKLTDSLVSFFGSKRVLWALGISCFILGVPVFPDTVFLLVIPLCTNLAKKTGISMMAFIAAIQTALITSSLVPPTPGPVAAAAALNLPLGIAIPWGILVSVPGTIATVLYAYYLKNDQIPLNEVYLSDGGDQQENVPNMNFKSHCSYYSSGHLDCAANCERSLYEGQLLCKIDAVYWGPHVSVVYRLLICAAHPSQGLGTQYGYSG